jgi:hypothetical protein
LIKKRPPGYGGLFVVILSGLKIARTNSYATVLLSALASFLAGVLEELGSGLWEFTSAHHAVLLEKITDCGSNYVAHRTGDKG